MRILVDPIQLSGRIPIPPMFLKSSLFLCVSSRVFAVHRTERHPGRAGRRLTTDLPTHTLGLNSTWQPMRQGFMHSPETSWKDNPPARGHPVRRFCPDLPCYAPLSHGTSRFEVGNRRSRRFELPTGVSASLFEVAAVGSLSDAMNLSFPSIFYLSQR